MARIALTGNDAAGVAFKQVNPDVAAVFPITPQTELMHKFAGFVANGEVETNLVTVESEHSAMSATVGAAAAGARAVTATSANGLALMFEIVYIAASLRLPIVMPVVNRALSGNINIHCDHSDTMGCRDSGWIQIHSENAQEVYDNVIQAFRIAEHPDVFLPVMVTLDGFILSHTMEVLDTLADEQVREFVGPFKPKYSLLDTEHPITVGPLDLQDYYFEHKRGHIEAMSHVPPVIEQIGQEYGKLAGRSYGLVEKFHLDDAQYVVVALGSAAGTCKAVINNLRKQGSKVGLLKIRSFRPFPGKLIRDILKQYKAVAVLDRSTSIGLEGGPLFNEIRSNLYGENVPLTNFIYGLGGRDLLEEHVEEVFRKLENIAAGREAVGVGYLGLRE